MSINMLVLLAAMQKLNVFLNLYLNNKTIVQQSQSLYIEKSPMANYLAINIINQSSNIHPIRPV